MQNLFKKLLYIFKKKKSPGVTYDFIFRYTEDILSINNNNFHPYVISIYPYKLHINGFFHVCFIFDIFFNRDITRKDKLYTKHYDKRDDFKLPHRQFPIFIYAAINLHVLHQINFLVEECYLVVNKLLLQVSGKFYGRYNNLVCPQICH